MKQDLNLAQKIRALKTNKSFTVVSEKDRQTVCRIAKCLKDAGFIEFDVVTKKEGDAFKVAAI